MKDVCPYVKNMMYSKQLKSDHLQNLLLPQYQIGC